MSAAAPVDIGRAIDDSPWGRYQKWLVFLTALTIVFDGIDNQLLGIAIPAIMKDWALPRSAFASIVALGYFGMMLGGLAAGLAGDRVGRRTALLGSMTIFGVMTMGAAAVTSLTGLTLLRFFAGVGLGGAIPNAAALAGEYVPARMRAFAVTLTIVCVPLGATLAGLVAITALPAFGWRALFTGGGVIPVVAAIALARALPESPRFLARHAPRWPELSRVLRRMGHDVPADASFVDLRETPVARASVGHLFRPEFARDTLALCGAFFTCLLAVYLVFSWLPSLLAGAGLGAIANTGITAFNLGGVVGAILGGRLILRIGSRVTMLGLAAGAAVCAAVMSTMTIAATAQAMPIIVMLTLTGGLINATQTTMYALAANVYPTPVRATGVGTAAAVGRLGAILSGYAGPWALAYRGSASFFGLIAVAMLSSSVALALVTRHVQSRDRA